MHFYVIVSHPFSYFSPIARCKKPNTPRKIWIFHILITINMNWFRDIYKYMIEYISVNLCA